MAVVAKEQGVPWWSNGRWCKKGLKETVDFRIAYKYTTPTPTVHPAAGCWFILKILKFCVFLNNEFYCVHILV